jgi:hypothetical protein
MAKDSSMTPLDELYWRYKTSTQVILNYHYTTGRQYKFRFECEDSMSLVEMRAAARLIAAKKMDVPRQVFWAFRSVIANRLQVARQYRQAGDGEADAEADRQHRYFVNLLHKLRDILLAGMDREKRRRDQARRVEQMEAVNCREPR